MEDKLPPILYQYRNNITAFKILEKKAIRLSDIRKSNDFTEMQLFFPDIFGAVLEEYRKNPFHIAFEGQNDLDAIGRLNYENYSIIRSSFENGDFTNFVACFSEQEDLLSQWRGYADDGRGCCLGYSREQLNNYCDGTGNILQLRKINYITRDEVEAFNRNSNSIFILQKLRENYENLCRDLEEKSARFDAALSYYYWVTLRIVLNNSLSFKLKEFEEEKEWRLFLADRAYKSPEYVIQKYVPEKTSGNTLFLETTGFLRDRIQHQVKDDDIVSFIEISHNEFAEQPLKSICLGPKNKGQKSDIDLFLAKNDYSNVNVTKSVIPYC